VYRVNTVGGVTAPNQITIRNTPFGTTDEVNADFGLYVQDKWTVDRFALALGLRYDYFKSGFPAQHLGPSQLLPNQDLSFPAQDNLNWKDITPRVGVAYDVTGTGKTAIKASINKYLQAQTVYVLGTDPNPINVLVQTTNRSWNDANRNWIPECDLVAPAANGECGALANSSFGKAGTTTFDPELLTGWGHRNFNWEFSAGVQRELLPRMSAEVSYFRRWYGNFQVTDNRLVSPSDYTAFSVTAPADTRLPGGGGNTITGLYDLNPDKVGQVQNHNTLSTKYGKQFEHWNGVDVTVNARPAEGVNLQGGLSSGRTMTDNCDVVSKLDNPSTRFCHVETQFLTQVKLFGTYTIPRVDVRFSATFQSLPGPEVLAAYNAPNALVAPSLGRPLSGGASNVAVALVQPGTMYGERTNQLDLRFSKLFGFGAKRAAFNVDLFNALNTDAVVRQSNNFANWQQAQGILQARFLKFGVQFDF
jgi:hypothetical protein